jgi:hypothetical protein
VSPPSPSSACELRLDGTGDPAKVQHLTPVTRPVQPPGGHVVLCGREPTLSSADRAFGRIPLLSAKATLGSSRAESADPTMFNFTHS